MSKVELEELKKKITDEENNCEAQKNYADLKICEANLALVDVLLFGRSNWNDEIFDA